MIRVLIADDSAFMRKLLSDVFEEDKDFVVVDTARNGQDAVEKVKRLKPDLVTMDVEMPVMDGLTATKEIRSIKRDDAAQIPIIAMTANAFEEDAKKCFAAGMNAHLAKPFQIDKVEKTLVQCIHKSI